MLLQSDETTTTVPQRDTVAEIAQAYSLLSDKTFVDLTHAFSPTTPVWEGFGQATFAPSASPETGEVYTIEDTGFKSTNYTLVGEYGTHCDPPSHFAIGGESMDNISLKKMIAPLVVLDNTIYQGEDPNHAFTRENALAWE